VAACFRKDPVLGTIEKSRWCELDTKSAGSCLHNTVCNLPILVAIEFLSRQPRARRAILLYADDVSFHRMKSDRAIERYPDSQRESRQAMRVSVTNRQHCEEQNLRPTSELAPALVLPWLQKLRYGVLAGECILIAIAFLFARVELSLVWLSVPLAVALASNLCLGRLATLAGARRVLGGVLVLDGILLTALLALTGGPANPFSLLYLVQITLSAVVLSRTWTWSLGVLSIAGFGFLFFFHVPLSVFEGHHTAGNFSAHLVGMWIAFVAAAALISILVGKVSQTLRNHEHELLRLQSLVARHEKVSSLAALAAKAAHEMGTPLGTIAIVAKELERHARDVEANGHVTAEAKLIRSEVERCSHILREMSSQGAKLTGETPALIKIDALLQQLRESFPEPQRSAIKIHALPDLSAVLPIETTRQVLSALVKNALEASLTGVNVQLAVESDTGILRFIVRDSGSGMSAEVLGRIAEPFYSTKRPERGMGLGTFLARVFAEDMGGSLIFDSAVNLGTTAILELPIADK
jgi:two-component system, sensor histidine kinase RegB